MKTNRILPILLTCAVLGLTACGDEKPSTTAGPAATSASAVPSSAAPSSAAPSPSAAAVSDKELCTAAEKINKDMRAKLMTAVQAGGDLTKQTGAILTELGDRVAQLAGTAGDGKAATALKEFAAEAGKAGSAADPGTAADNPAMEKASKDINAACRTAGAPTTF
ncbi:hypothetical protein [Micromonospora sp. LA-10]|uniref:hypothetical protein n=1 Tax=Micromonospora sp. LA-10 TaxID=3446364 RepID=UPI003828420F